jgi:hypothetical protein
LRGTAIAFNKVILLNHADLPPLIPGVYIPIGNSEVFGAAVRVFIFAGRSQ